MSDPLEAFIAQLRTVSTKHLADHDHGMLVGVHKDLAEYRESVGYRRGYTDLLQQIDEVYRALNARR